MKQSRQSEVTTISGARRELIDEIISHYRGLAKAGYVIAMQALKDQGFKTVHKIGDKARWTRKRKNRRRYKISYGSLLALRGRSKYVIVLRTRHKYKKNGKLNRRYKLTDPRFKGDFHSDAARAERHFRAEAHWIAVPIDVDNGTYSVFFGSLRQLGDKSAIPMGESSLKDHVCLVREKRLTDILVIRNTGEDKARKLREYTNQFRQLASKFRPFYRPPTADDVERFVRQFPVAYIDGVVKMLHAIKFYEQSNFQSLLKEFKSENEPLLSKASVFCPLDEPGGSSSLMTYIASHVVRKARCLPLQEALALASQGTVRRIILVEDCILSGYQASDILREYLSLKAPSKYVEPLTKEQKRILAKTETFLLAFLATDEGMDEINRTVRRRLPKLKVVRMGRCDKTKLFDPANTIFDPSIRADAQTFFANVGYSLLKERAESRWPKAVREERMRKHAIGYGDDQLLVVFYYNVPKATVTLLWERGKYRESDWFPLFPVQEN